MGGRLHPAVADVRRAVRTACADIEPGSTVVVACSGGADSMALASATLFEARSAAWLVEAAVIDHQLQTGSAGVAAAVADRLRAMGYDDDGVHLLTVEVGPTGGPEAAARDARFDALQALAAQAGATVLLGHTRDDQAETVLLGLARGSGPRSLAGMSPQRGCFRRPMLSLSRATTQAACEAQGLEVWDDPHNLDPSYTRVRVRHEVLPMLERTLGPGISAALARTADLSRDDADALDALATAVYVRAADDAGRLDVSCLLTALPAIRRRALRLAAVAAGVLPGELTATHLDEVDRLLTHWHGQAGVDLPGHLRARRHEGLIWCEPNPAADGRDPQGAA